ncbi:uncharacterized protein TNCV_4506431 [Trichonephila clavipes]|nr:uncharacterized protein TNCV_4506431 [Trichonephila clavipes]
MTKISPFAVQKALIGISGEPKSVERLRSEDLLVETNSALQTKSFLLAKSFLDSPVTISPHKILNSCRGIISETYLLGTPDGEILQSGCYSEYAHTYRILCAALSARGSDTHKLPAAVNLLALDVHLTYFHRLQSRAKMC